jgi:RNA recognition motif-containing protein
MKQDIFAFIQEKGLFNPYWGKGEDAWLEDDFGFDSEEDREVKDEIHAIKFQRNLVLADAWLKVLEAKLLRNENSPISELQKYLVQFEKDFQKEEFKTICEMAQEKFNNKHPGFANCARITTEQLKICWNQESS